MKLKLARPTAALSDVLEMNDQIHPRRNGTIGGPWRTYRTASRSNEDIDGTEKRFRIEILSTPKRTEMPRSGKLCMGYGRHRTYQMRGERARAGRMNDVQSLQLLGNGGVFP